MQLSDEQRVGGSNPPLPTKRREHGRCVQNAIYNEGMKQGEYEVVYRPPPEYPGTVYGNNCVLEHRLVWWQHTGHVPTPNEIVHHINGDKRDNRFENLKIMRQSEHVRLHGEKRPRAEMMSMICDWCGCRFETLARNVKAKRSAGQKRFYCSRSHSGSGSHKRG